MESVIREIKATLTTSDGRVIELEGIEAECVLQAAEAVTNLTEVARPFDSLVSGLLRRRIHGATEDGSVEAELTDYRNYLLSRSEIVAEIAKHEPHVLRDALKVA
jgi:hypothetical protein